MKQKHQSVIPAKAGIQCSRQNLDPRLRGDDIVHGLFWKIARYCVMIVYLLFGGFFLYMERAAAWVIGVNKRTEYLLEGSCNKCGKCCKLLAIQYPRFFNRYPRLIKTTIRWHHFRYGFNYEGKDNNYLLYSCGFLKDNGRCGIYRLRPRLCREYPKLKLYGPPPLHHICGFHAIRRDGKPTFREAFREAMKK